MSEELKKEIEACNVKFMEHFGKNDMKGLSELYTEDCKLMPTGSETLIGREGVQKVFGGAYAGGAVKVKLVVDEVGMVHTDTLAYERSQYFFYNSKDEVVDHGKYVVVWKKVDGNLYLYTDIFNTNKKA